jgi:hypothetical protein
VSRWSIALVLAVACGTSAAAPQLSCDGTGRAQLRSGLLCPAVHQIWALTVVSCGPIAFRMLVAGSVAAADSIDTHDEAPTS